ncbi:hypothetical protein QE441_003768 [Chryseobacterium sp. SORGH_AS909]|uniref:Uncharacterized protein n=1 Tax=Chryseobacterium camelliae TaxID=1265445 RepID=A0ABU0TI11_9FLAO|nr:hypothetical protein [Chryseobacterium camelliae]MDQ1100636.1 hypothetical protein [Chryseobacterium sp. SORGH_AS_1048]MDR6087974.1 hypothetical protein [Chryseobacterium sp. SORGH_AS_0909]MDR6132349.1 hypothetical protein [Chryseobacterium sp. SORGH_AS_1175]MDT3409442.1 hypothetical protein [Pseudacidovorax intermedius]
MLKTNYRETVLKKISRLRNIILEIVVFCISLIAAGIGLLLYYGYITNSNRTIVYDTACISDIHWRNCFYAVFF